jgi:hypothetical protein
MHKYIFLEVDNINLVYSWEKKNCKNDQHASILLRSLHVLEAGLECRFYMQHTMHMSSPLAVLVDKLSRSATTTEQELVIIRHLNWHALEGPLMAWLDDPVLDWDLPLKLVTWMDALLAGDGTD